MGHPAMDWFANNDDTGPNRTFQTDITKGEPGDVLFSGNIQSGKGHAAVVVYVKQNSNGTVSIKVISTNVDANYPDDLGVTGEKTYTAKQKKDGTWTLYHKDRAGHDFRGYGQIIKENNKGGN